MKLYIVHWDTDETKWGRSTDWVVRAKSLEQAISLCDGNIDQATGENRTLEAEEILADGLPEIILSYGPDA